MIAYNFLNLPEKVTQGNDKYLTYIYDATGRKLSQQVYTSTGVLLKKTDYMGEFFYENDTLKFINHEEGRVVMKDGPAEYQYHLKDHLGNVRLTFTTKADVEENTATMETANAGEESSQFLHYDEAVIVNNPWFDHTHDGTTGETYYATRLTGGNADEVYGLAKSLSIMPAIPSALKCLPNTSIPTVAIGMQPSPTS